MKNLLALLVCCFGTLAYSQNDDLFGEYSMRSGNPEGGATLYIMPNNNFLVGYFGGMRKGTWEFKQNAYAFKYQVEPKVVLYGRHQENLKDSIAVNMSVDASSFFAVRFNVERNVAFKPIFNRGANCMSYPYIHKQKDALKSLEIYVPQFRYYESNEASSDGNDSDNDVNQNVDNIQDLSEIYRFKNDDGFNDFIVAALPGSYSEAGEFRATYKNGFLILNNGLEHLKKSGDYKDLDEETLDFIKEYTEKEILPKQLKHGNEFFPNYELPMQSDLKPFTRIEAQILSPVNIIISEKSLFTHSCD